MMDNRVLALEEIREHAAMYAERDSYTSGERDEVFAHPMLRRALARSAGRYNLNLSRRIVDAVLDRLEVTAFTVIEQEGNTPPGSPSPVPDGTGDTLTDVLGDQVWAANELDLELPDAFRKALGYGDGYLFVWPADNLADDGAAGEVDIFFNPPTTTRLFYDAENPRLKAFAAKAWRVGTEYQPQWRLTMYYPDRIERWITRTGVKGDRPDDFMPFDDPDDLSTVEDGHIVPNPYGVVPVFHLRPNERPYGRPEAADAYGPQDAVTKLVATLLDTVDYHGAPQRYALTGRHATDQVSDLFDDETDELDKPDSSVSNLRANPGSVWFLKNVDAIGQLDPADVSAFMSPTGMMLRFASALTATPMRYFEPTGVMPSGEAQRADEAPLIKKVEKHQLNFGGVLRDVAEFAMLVLGYDVEVSVQWAAPQSVDDLEGWQAVNEKIKAGVPVRQALMEAGYTADQVDAWFYQHDENDVRRRVELLVSLGAAVQSLGAGVALGVLTPEAVTEVITSVMPEPGDSEDPTP